MELKLTRLEKDMAAGLDSFLSGWRDERIPSSLRRYDGDIEKFMDYLLMMETDPPRLLVPATLLFFTDGQKMMGAVEIRHFLNDGLLKYGGHIGYGIAPAHRGNGYAAAMLKLAFPHIKNLGISQVLVCCKKHNIASAKTILKCGGVLENEVPLVENGISVTGQRYWISL